MLDFAGMLKVFALVIALCAVALVVVRLMGNRTVGQLSPFDFIILVGIGDIIITTAMDRTQDVLAGVGGLLALLALQQLLGYLALKSKLLRRCFEGQPVILVQDGQLIKENFKKIHLNYDDLRQELHRVGMDMTDLPAIKLARLESCGAFSVIKQKDREPLTKKDLEDLLAAAAANPLSPWGEKLAKWERAVNELELLLEKLKEKQRGG